MEANGPDDAATTADPDPRVAALAEALIESDMIRRYREYANLLPTMNRDEADAEIAREWAAAILAVWSPDAWLANDPFAIWQGSCGHLWRRLPDPNDCPVCAEIARPRNAVAAYLASPEFEERLARALHKWIGAPHLAVNFDNWDEEEDGPDHLPPPWCDGAEHHAADAAGIVKAL